MRAKATPVLYLDLDGTVRKGYDELGKFVNSADDVELFDEVPALLNADKKRGYRIVGVSNQGGVALGHLSYENMQAAMLRTQQLSNYAFDKIVACVHHPDAKDPEMARCWCRKPRAGLVIEGALSLSEIYPNEYYPPHLALFVGDRPEDASCADNANIQFIPAAEWRKEEP